MHWLSPNLHAPPRTTAGHSVSFALPFMSSGCRWLHCVSLVHLPSLAHCRHSGTYLPPDLPLPFPSGLPLLPFSRLRAASCSSSGSSTCLTPFFPPLPPLSVLPPLPSTLYGVNSAVLRSLTIILAILSMSSWLTSRLSSCARATASLSLCRLLSLNLLLTRLTISSMPMAVISVIGLLSSLT